MWFVGSTRRKWLFEVSNTEHLPEGISVDGNILKFDKVPNKAGRKVFDSIDECLKWKVDMEKQIKVTAGSRSEINAITDQDWELISKMLPKGSDKTKEDFVKFTDYLCNNMIDRDIERFTEDVLKRFAKTIIGKQKLSSPQGGHNWSQYGIGRYFKSDILPIVKDEAKRLHPDEKTFEKQYDYLTKEGGSKWLVADYYVPKHKTEIIEDIQSGLPSSSIGFGGVDRKKVEHDGLKFIELVLTPETEAFEGSLVGVEAQRNAGAKSMADDNPAESPEVKEFSMEFKIENLGTYEVTDEDSAKTLTDAVTERLVKDAEIQADLVGQVDTQKSYIETLETAYGGEFGADNLKELLEFSKGFDELKGLLVADVVKFGKLSGEITDENIQAKQETFTGFKINELQERLELYQNMFNDKKTTTPEVKFNPNRLVEYSLD